MAGPAFNILMRYPLTAAQIGELDVWLRTFTLRLQTRINASRELDSWSFCIDGTGAPDTERLRWWLKGDENVLPGFRLE